MKAFSFIATAFAISASLAAASAIPAEDLAFKDIYTAVADAGNITSLAARDDDIAEWTMVLYPTPLTEGDQCGGTGTEITGSGQQSCVKLPKTSYCVDFKITSTIIGITCIAQFGTKSCPDSGKGVGTGISLVQDGEGSGGQSERVGQNEPAVRFVQINCNGD
ncbi:hypothetical protein PRZ48_002393 [Zasmidium cellare]|uniref:Uncharacterized protein n=1 Tax=Zasmidium cellare TaxID=395010 RepID=A0ABR0F3W7_ZASCE|nr:hypothetical protein PRZ48_002393 [Zasmidium cellare]